jgi:GAF domain-containing protein
MSESEPKRIESLRRSLEGICASFLATCDAAGKPNVSMISQVHYVDSDHVALSYQFFNKTRRNLLLTRMASVLVVDPDTIEIHRLDLDYIETRTSGPVFEVMKAKLAGIASHHGMEGVFRLLGADLFRIRRIEAVPYHVSFPAPVEHQLLPHLRKCVEGINRCDDLEAVIEAALDGICEQFGIRHAMVLMAEPEQQRLFTVASRGYGASGVGSEVAFGEGVIGVAARERIPIRIGHMTAEYRYGSTLVQTAERAGIVARERTEIPFPGLKSPRSQIAVPILFRDQMSGVIFAESDEPVRFGFDEEDALATLAAQLGAALAAFDIAPADEEETGLGDHPAPAGQVTVRYYDVDQSVFINNEYLIKGVAGAILWRVLTEFVETGRTEFTTRQLRIDPLLRLPEYAENFDARLILLRKRLAERNACVRIERAGRGRYHLVAHCGIRLSAETAA